MSTLERIINGIRLKAQREPSVPGWFANTRTKFRNWRQAQNVKRETRKTQKKRQEEVYTTIRPEQAYESGAVHCVKGASQFPKTDAIEANNNGTELNTTALGDKKVPDTQLEENSSLLEVARVKVQLVQLESEKAQANEARLRELNDVAFRENFLKEQLEIVGLELKKKDSAYEDLEKRNSLVEIELTDAQNKTKSIDLESEKDSSDSSSSQLYTAVDDERDILFEKSSELDPCSEVKIIEAENVASPESGTIHIILPSDTLPSLVVVLFRRQARDATSAFPVAKLTAPDTAVTTASMIQAPQLSADPTHDTFLRISGLYDSGNYSELFGLNSNRRPEKSVIVAAFRMYSKTYHPDKNRHANASDIMSMYNDGKDILMQSIINMDAYMIEQSPLTLHDLVMSFNKMNKDPSSYLIIKEAYRASILCGNRIAFSYRIQRETTPELCMLFHRVESDIRREAMLISDVIMNTTGNMITIAQNTTPESQVYYSNLTDLGVLFSTGYIESSCVVDVFQIYMDKLEDGGVIDPFQVADLARLVLKGITGRTSNDLLAYFSQIWSSEVGADDLKLFARLDDEDEYDSEEEYYDEEDDEEDGEEDNEMEEY